MYSWPMFWFPLYKSLNSIRLFSIILPVSLSHIKENYNPVCIQAIIVFLFRFQYFASIIYMYLCVFSELIWWSWYYVCMFSIFALILQEVINVVSYISTRVMTRWWCLCWSRSDVMSGSGLRSLLTQPTRCLNTRKQEVSTSKWFTMARYVMLGWYAYGTHSVLGFHLRNNWYTCSSKAMFSGLHYIGSGVNLRRTV